MHSDARSFESVFWLLSVANTQSVLQQDALFTTLFLAFDVVCLLAMLSLFGAFSIVCACRL